MDSGQAQCRRVIYPHDGCVSSGGLSLAPGDVLEVEPAEGEWWTGRLVQSGDRTPPQPHDMGYFYSKFTVPVEPNEPAEMMSLPHINSLTDGHSVTYGKNDYISQVSPSHEMKCMICFNLASRTYQSTCCGRTMCLACAETWKETNNSCPQCRQAPLNLSIDVRVEHDIANLKVYCRNHSKGCGWMDRLGDEAAHSENSCQYTYATVKCEYQGCCVELPLKDDLQKHMSSECLLRPVQCPCCKTVDMIHDELFLTFSERRACGNHQEQLPKLTYNHLITKHYKVCPDWPMRCPNKCPIDNLTRVSLQAHLDEDCPEQVMSCQLSEAGCEERVKRRKMEEHIQNMGQHWAGMVKDYIKLKKEHAVLIKEHAALKKKPAALKKKPAAELNLIHVPYSSDSELED